MFETTTHKEIRSGIERAHKERAKAVRAAFRWISGRRH